MKGKRFTLPELLGSVEQAKRFGRRPTLAIFRLAPQDYHRFHSPVTGTIESITTLPGDYYTVNPQAVNQPLNVFTANRRDVLIMNTDIGKAATDAGTTAKTIPVAIVAVGALLVGSVGWVYKVGEAIPKGEELGESNQSLFLSPLILTSPGWFQYGGSTVVIVFPEEANVKWDDDLHKASIGVWTGTEDPAIMAMIPPNAQIGPLHEGEQLGLEVLVRAAEKIGIFAPIAMDTV